MLSESYSDEFAKWLERLTPNDNLIKEYLSRSCLNLEELALIFKYFGINYDAPGGYESLQNFEVYIEEVQIFLKLKQIILELLIVLF